MRQHLAELLASAVSTTYGSYYGSVLSALTTRSRATSTDIIRALPRLSSGDVRLALVTLVQQHLVNHHTEESGITYYEPNWENAYNFTCRVPTLYKFIEERFDDRIAQVFNAVAQAGLISVSDLLLNMGPDLPVPNANTEANAVKAETETAKADKNGGVSTEAKGFPPSRLETEKALYGALNLMLSTGYIMRVNLRQFWPLHDRENEAINETILVHFPAGVSNKKDRDALQQESAKLLRQWRNEDETYNPPTPNGMTKSDRKRAISPDFRDSVDESESPANKRRQLNGQIPSHAKQHQAWLSEHQSPLDSEMVLAVNFEKCAVGLRTNQFTQFCERHMHPTTAKVYRALLHILEVKSARCFDLLQSRPETEREFFGAAYEKPKKIDIGLSDPVTTKEVANMLDPELDLSEGLAFELEDDVAPSIENTKGVNGHTAQDDNDENRGTSRLHRIEQHLRALVCDPRGLVRTKRRDWLVPFHATTQRIIEAELESAITHTLGTLPARIIRILKYYGHQELRHLASRAMVTEDQARNACQLLQQAGWVDVVELPRTARREVTKSLWLWSYDVLKARQKCLSDCYFSMTRLSLRLQKERQTIERVIDKSERSDVQGNEDKFLNREEKAALAKFGRQTDLVTRQLIRMDELVAVMRDFTAMEYPHKLWDHGWIEWYSPEGDPIEDEKRLIEEFEGERVGADGDFHDDEEDAAFVEPE